MRRHDPDATASLERVLRLAPSELSDLARFEGHPTDSGAPGAGSWGVGGAMGQPQRLVEAAAARLLVEDVAWQFGALELGFWSAASREVGCWMGTLEASTVTAQKLPWPVKLLGPAQGGRALAAG
jgi:hypothetical protein